MRKKSKAARRWTIAEDQALAAAYNGRNELCYEFIRRKALERRTFDACKKRASRLGLRRR